LLVCKTKRLTFNTWYCYIAYNITRIVSNISDLSRDIWQPLRCHRNSTYKYISKTRTRTLVMWLSHVGVRVTCLRVTEDVVRDFQAVLSNRHNYRLARPVLAEVAVYRLVASFVERRKGWNKWEPLPRKDRMYFFQQYSLRKNSPFLLLVPLLFSFLVPSPLRKMSDDATSVCKA